MAEDLREKLERRQEARLSEIDRKRQERARETRPEESPQLLFSTFMKEKQSLEEMLSGLGDLETNMLREQFDNVTRKSQTLQKFLSDSLAFLPSYDVKQLQQHMKKLEQDINDKRNLYLPKKKFAFSKKKQISRKADPDHKPDGGIKDDTQTAESKLEDPTNTPDVFITGEQIIREQSFLKDKHITFSKLRKCTVILHGSPSALHLRNLEQCKVFCGPVSGSIFIHDCMDCVFVFPCQQLRVHTTVKSQFYVHVTSRAIIEDCHELGFAELNWTYDDMDCHFENSGLDHAKNNWNLVKDFNWLGTDVPSPNWYFISDENKVKCWK